MPKIITIDDSNYQQYLSAPSGQGMGLVPRDFSTHPQGYLGRIAEPFNLPLIPENEWDARITEQEATKSSLQHWRDVGMFGARIPSRDQNGKGYCWAHSTTSAMLLLRASMGLPYRDLSAYMVACIIKGYRDEGGWNSESLKFIVENGVATSATWPQQSMSRSNDNPAMRAEAAQNKCTEWWDLSDNKATVKQQLATLLLLNVPVMIDLNWWGHSVCAVRLVRRDPFTIRQLNSWGDGWSDHGMGDLVDSKAIPDGAAAPRVAMAA